MEDKRTISIKVNGKEQPLTDQKPVKKESAEPKEKKEFTWVLPAQNLSQPKIEEFQDRQKSPPKFQKPKKTHSLRSPPNVPWQRKKNKPRKKPPRSNEGKKIGLKKQWIPAFSAVLVGVVMGMIVLTMFTDGQAEEAAGHEDVMNEAEPSSGHSAANTADLNLSFVQGGAFSSKENAQEPLKSLQKDGFPAILNQDGEKVYLFIGAATDKSAAKQLGDLYKQKGQDVYVKAFQVSPDAAQLNKQTAQFLEDSKTLLDTLSKGSAHGLASEGGALTDQQWRGFEKTYQQWEKESDAKQLPSEAKPLAAEIKKAVKPIHDYRKEPHKDKLWQTQQHILKAALQYKKIANS